VPGEAKYMSLVLATPLTMLAVPRVRPSSTKVTVPVAVMGDTIAVSVTNPQGRCGLLPDVSATKLGAIAVFVTFSRDATDVPAIAATETSVPAAGTIKALSRPPAEADLGRCMFQFEQRASVPPENHMHPIR